MAGPRMLPRWRSVTEAFSKTPHKFYGFKKARITSTTQSANTAQSCQKPERCGESCQVELASRS